MIISLLDNVLRCFIQPNSTPKPSLLWRAAFLFPRVIEQFRETLCSFLLALPLHVFTKSENVFKERSFLKNKKGKHGGGGEPREKNKFTLGEKNHFYNFGSEVLGFVGQKLFEVSSFICAKSSTFVIFNPFPMNTNEGIWGLVCAYLPELSLHMGKTYFSHRKKKITHKWENSFS